MSAEMPELKALFEEFENLERAQEDAKREFQRLILTGMTTYLVGHLISSGRLMTSVGDREIARLGLKIAGLVCEEVDAELARHEEKKNA